MIYISIALVLVWIFIVLMIRSKIRKISRVSANPKEIPSRYTNKIEVALYKCVIKQGEFYFSLSDTSFLTSLRRKENENSINKEASVIIYRKPLPDNQFEECSSDPIFKDEITLSFLFDKQKKTYIYVDPDDKSKYFFDLRFLFEK